MDAWSCVSCQCEYTYTEPDESSGMKLCPVCADDPEKVKRATSKADSVNGVWWFLLGILAGMVISLFIAKLL